MPRLTGSRMGANHTVTSDRCVGCGQTDRHRPDCTVEPSALRCYVEGCTVVRLPGVKQPLWVFRPSLGYVCPEHQK